MRFVVGRGADNIDYVRLRMVAFAKAVVLDRLMVRPVATASDLKYLIESAPPTLESSSMIPANRRRSHG